MKKILCAFIAAALLILGGCGSSSPVTYGRYVDTEAEAMGRQIILREDGNCSFRYSALYSLSFRGTYEVGDGTLTITNSEGKHYVSPSRTIRSFTRRTPPTASTLRKPTSR